MKIKNPMPVVTDIDKYKINPIYRRHHAERLDYIFYFKEYCCLKRNNTLEIVA